MKKKEIPENPEKKKKSFPDWDAIRNDYITGNATPKECAKLHGVNYRTLGNHLYRERWNDQRTAYRGAVTDKAIETAKNCTAYRVASELTVLSHVVEALERELKKALEDGEQLHRYLVQSTTRHKDGTTETTYKDITSDKVDTRALRDLTDSVKTLEALKRSLHGLDTAQERHRKQIETERLALERERLQIEKERLELTRKREERDADGVKGVQIVVGGYCDEYSE
nr:MAG TPA: hypothetical protein [Caudoviricetes sp.]